MATVISRIAWLIGVVIFGGIAAAGLAQGTRPQPSDDILPQLLNEVRGLRVAIEQMASAGPRVQLALGRVQLQEQRILNQLRRLDSVRASLQAAQKDAEPLEKLAKDLDEIIRDRPNSEGRSDAEKELARLKADLAKQHALIAQLTLEESTLVGDIAAEQNRWTEFNQRLEELERVLGRR
jgi:hypothetical protein